MFIPLQIYNDRILDAALTRLNSLGRSQSTLAELLERANIEKPILKRTLKQTIIGYIDMQDALRHGWKPKLISGKPEEKEKLYKRLHSIVERLDVFSESYTGAMRLVLNSGLLILNGSPTTPDWARSKLEETLKYEGAKYVFDEEAVEVRTEGKSKKHLDGETQMNINYAYEKVANETTRLKDLLNLMEEATSPEFHKYVRNTNEFPEARIGKSFEVRGEIDKSVNSLKEAYSYILANAPLTSESGKRIDPNIGKNVRGVLSLLHSQEQGTITKAIHWYADLKHNEKVWDTAYWTSMTGLLATVAGEIYMKTPYATRSSGFAHEAMKVLGSHEFAIFSGLMVCAFTEIGPKIAKLMRKCDHLLFRYEAT